MKKREKVQFILMDNDWGQHEVEERKVYYWKIGDCNLWIRKEKTEIYIAWSYEKVIDAADVPEGLAWSRFTTKEELRSVEIAPVMPDRPLVVKPEDSFYLTIGTKRTIYIRIPVWICLSLVEKNKTKILEIPSVILSNTWFGDVVEGELCYWITSGARSQIEIDPSRPFMSICSLTLYNSSNENLLVEKFIVRDENSSLFLINRQLWTDEILISYKGKNEISSVQFRGRPHKEISGAKKIADPRKRQNKKLLLKTFDSIIDNHILGMPIK